MGSPITSKRFEALKLKALVMVAVMAGVVPSLTQEGAVHVVRLWVALEAAVPIEPVLAAQENESAELWGSLAATS